MQVTDSGPATPLITFDLFSALIDSRTGASRVLERMARERRWRTDGTRIYDAWDRRNKLLQQRSPTWLPFVELSRRAMSSTYQDLQLDGDAGADADRLLDSVGEWPLWPDVRAGLTALRHRARIGVLSNVDDEVYGRTRVSALGIRPTDVLTSERLQAYKPSSRMYRLALEERPDLRFHVASSARDVRGALEAGMPTIRLVRPGHLIDPDGPAPERQVHDIAEIASSAALWSEPR